jgi:hypothetical protein
MPNLLAHFSNPPNFSANLLNTALVVVAKGGLKTNGGFSPH